MAAAGAPAMNSSDDGSSVPLECRPGVLLVGSPNVGKRTLLSRLLSVDIPDTHDLSSGVLCQGWTIETKYYSADVSIWVAHLREGFSIESLPNHDQLAALVMVFDVTDEATFRTMQQWVAQVDISRFEILLCIGNKVDLIPGHCAHAEYRRRIQKGGDPFSSPNSDFADFGIDEYEGLGLLRNEKEPDPCLEIIDSSAHWCIQNNIEYINACGSNAEFDNCLSVDGDSQGVERLFGALSAHMWPGMRMRTGNRINITVLAEKEELSDDESDYNVEYEILSHGSDEPWDYVGQSSMENIVPESSKIAQNSIEEVRELDVSTSLPHHGKPEIAGTSATIIKNNEAGDSDHDQPSTTGNEMHDGQQTEFVDTSASFDEEHHSIDDLERLMSEISNLRCNLRLMPDFQRRERAANIAMKMAAMFGDDGEDEEQ